MPRAASAEVSCLDVTPAAGQSATPVAAVGLWTDISVCLLGLEAMSVLQKEGIGGEVILRSVLMADFDGDSFLLCASGDGVRPGQRLLVLNTGDAPGAAS